jgi:hypothetical protein
MFFIKLSYSFIKENKTYKIFAWLEQYAFWVYATHGIALAVMVKLSVKIMPMNGGWLLVHYFMVTLLCILILLGIGIIFRKIFPMEKNKDNREEYTKNKEEYLLKVFEKAKEWKKINC